MVKEVVMARRLGRTLTSATLALVLLAACTDPSPEPSPTPPATTPEPTSAAEPTTEPTTEEPEEPPEPEPPLDAYGVSAGHPLAVDVGARVLDAGGNTADAIVAAAFAVAVVEPYASGIGGGGAAIVVPPDGDPMAYDYREVVAGDGRVPASGVGIPGFVAGMAQLHADHGRLAWPDVLAPAIALAREGFDVTPLLALRMTSDRGPQAISGLSHFRPGEHRLVQAELAQTMTAIADEGPEAFYSGSLVPALSSIDGIDAESLAAYEVVTADPVGGAFGDYEVLSAPPALPGVAVIQLLQVAEAAGLGDAAPGSAAYMASIGQGWAVASETANTVLGDPAFVDVPVAELTDPARNAALTGRTAVVGPLGPHGSEHAGNTTHLTVVDTDGLMISMTNTITNFWGSQQYVAGFFVNDQLTRFSIGTTGANQPAPGRRSVSWSAPTVLLDGEGRPVLGIGSPGGVRIPQLLAGVLGRWALHGQSLDEAVQASRFAYEPGRLLLESEPSSELAGALNSPYEVIPPSWAYFGSVQALEVDYDARTVIGSVDRRRDADLIISEP